MDERTKKAVLRRMVLARRSRISPSERTAAGRAASLRVIEHPIVATARNVLGFASFGAEIPTDELLEELLRRGVKLCLPYVGETGTMDVAVVSSLEELVPGYRGIREPATRESVAKADLDVAVVPGVAFDSGGRRLGHGGGFYDRYLAELPRSVPRIGLCFDLQVVDVVPAAEHDQSVDYIVTEARTIECESRRDA
jgi:5-formyltetrahydrofolate cyclo-ligase